MAQEIVGIKLQIDGQEKVVQSIGEVKKLLKQANDELVAAQTNFGEYSEQAVKAANKVAYLKDTIQEARETADLFDPGKKFQAFAGAASAVAGGFSAVQGALGLVGVQSGEVEKALLKVQSAMALSQGLSTIADSIKDFQRLGAVIQSTTLFQKANNIVTVIATTIQRAFGVATIATGTAFKILKAAIISTGIGALVVLIGSAISAIMSWTDSTEEQEAAQAKMNKEMERADALYKQQVKNLQFTYQLQQKDAQLRGDNAVQRANAAKAQLEAEAALHEAEAQRLRTQYTTMEAQLKNEEITTEMFNAYVERFNNAKNQLDETRNQILLAQKDIAIAQKEMDDETARKKAEEEKKVAEENARQFEQQMNQIKERNKQRQQEIDNATKESAQRTKELQEEIFLANIKDDNAREQAKLKIDYDNSRKEIEQSKALEKQKQAELKALEEKYNIDLNDLKEEQRKQEEQRVKEFEEELAELRTKTRLDGIKDQFQKAREETLLDFNKQREEVFKNENLKAFERIAILAELKKQELAALAAIDEEEAISKAAKEMADIDKLIERNEADFNLERDLLNRKEQLLKDQLANNIITQEQYNEAYEQLSDARKEIDRQEAEFKKSQVQEVGNIIQNLTNIVGKETAAGKALGIATALINTYQGASEAIKQQSTLPSPFDVISKIANVGAIIATGLKTVKSITAVQVPGGGGGGTQTGTGFSAAPIPPAPTPQVQSTLLNAQAIQTLGNATSRSYVIESDVSSSQERIRRINRAARLG